MNNEILMDAISYLDSDLLAEHLKRKEELRRKPRRSLMPVLLKWSAIAASLVLTVTSVFLISEQLFKAPPDDPPISTDHPTDNNATFPIVTEKPTATEPSVPSIEVDLKGINFDGKAYYPETELSKIATEKNVGDFLGVVPSGEELVPDLYAFKYLSDDDKKQRIIIPYNNKFYVYVFFRYNLDEENKEYPAILLDRAVEVGVDDGLLDPSLMTDVDYIKFVAPDNVEGFIEFLKDLTANEKYSSEYINDYIFNSGEPTNKRRYIRVTLEDKTYLEYGYIVGTGTLTFGSGGYILTEEQNEELRSLMGMD